MEPSVLARQPAEQPDLVSFRQLQPLKPAHAPALAGAYALTSILAGWHQTATRAAGVNVIGSLAGAVLAAWLGFQLAGLLLARRARRLAIEPGRLARAVPSVGPAGHRT
jgi:hypothetical protein